MTNPHDGSTLDSLLKETGELDEVNQQVAKRTELVVEMNEATRARYLLVRDPETNWYYEVIIGFRWGNLTLAALYATCSCFRKLSDDSEPTKVSRIQLMGPIKEYLDAEIKFKRVDVTTLDFSNASLPWKEMAMDVVDTYKVFLDRKLAAEY